MFKLYLRNPESGKMEITHVETATQAEAMCLRAWPECRVSAAGEVIVDRQRLVEGRNGPVMDMMTLVVARIEFQDKL
jgi:hypothetical protein